MTEPLDQTMDDAAVTSIGRLFWHHDVHEHWTRRRMYFWFFSFETFYSQEEVLGTLHEMAAELGIVSYATYELLGSYDVVGRLYLDRNEEHEFSKVANRRLKPLGMKKQQPFCVGEVVRHWVWAKDNASGPIRTPDRRLLNQYYPRSELALIDAERDSPERQALIAYYAERDLVTEAPRTYGIKFVVRIGTPDSLTDDDRQRVKRRLARTLDGAGDLLMERSLYAGLGEQREIFLIMYRIAHQDFHKLRKHFIEPLRQAVDSIKARAETYPVVSDDFLCFEDRLAIEPPPRPDLEGLLAGDETSFFEVKGSLFSPLDPWLKQGAELQESDALPLKGVLKAIVGLLNSGGGTVLVGAVEPEKYLDSDRATAMLAAFPECGRFRILGLIDPTYVEKGADVWDRQLRDLIASKVDRNPGVLVQPRFETIAGLPVCVIEVDEAGEDDAFYLQTTRDTAVYYARHGTEVVALKGSQMEEHRKQMRQHRRRLRRPKPGGEGAHE